MTQLNQFPSGHSKQCLRLGSPDRSLVWGHWLVKHTLPHSTQHFPISASSASTLYDMLSRFSRVRPSVTPWTVACQAPLSVGCSRQESWSGLPCTPPRIFPAQGSTPCLFCLLRWQVASFTVASATWESGIRVLYFLKYF